MMIISAQFAESGFIDLCARTITGTRGGTAALLALTVAIGGALSAVLANDILIIAIAPLLVAGAQRRGLDPRPFVIALAAATNAGSAATLIGNPQNILLGAIGRLGFWHFLAINGLPALFALVSVFAVVWLQWSRRMRQPAVEPVGSDYAAAPVPAHPIDRFQMIKAGVALMALLILFSTPLPREIGALIIAALLLANRRITSRTMIATVDWPLLLLVACLFAITGQLNDAGIAARLLALLSDSGLLPNNLAVLLPFALVTSNAIGSVPAAMLLLQIWPLPPDSVLYSLALLSSLAGNLLLSGSLSTLLVAEQRGGDGGAGELPRLCARRRADRGDLARLCELLAGRYRDTPVDAAAGSAADSMSAAARARALSRRRVTSAIGTTESPVEGALPGPTASSRACRIAEPCSHALSRKIAARRDRHRRQFRQIHKLSSRKRYGCGDAGIRIS